jgi:hypothetical protein
MKFGKYLQRHVLPILAGDPRYAQLHAAVVEYKGLKQMLNSMDFAVSRARCAEVFGEDEVCSICLDALGRRCDAVQTRCGHLFHPCCLLDALSVHASKGRCPLCRTSLVELVPANFDCDTLRFLARVRVGIDAADACYERYVEYLEFRVDLLLSVMADEVERQRRRRHFDRIVSAFFAIDPPHRERVRHLAHTASELCAHLAAARLFAAANHAGYYKILKKFDRRSAARPLSPHVVACWLAHRGFVRDQSGGRCRVAAMRRRLAVLLQ